jgi:hypothetical protein
MAKPVLIWYGNDALLLCSGTILKGGTTTPLYQTEVKSFTTVQTPFGTYPTASGYNDPISFISSNGSVTITGNATNDTIDFTVVPAVGTLAGLSDVALSSPSVGQFLGYNGTKWINISAPIGVGSGVVFFPDDTDSDIGGYDSLYNYPTGAGETEDLGAVTSSTSPVLIKAFASASGGLGSTSIEGGAWDFSVWAKTTGITDADTLLIRVYKRTTGGSETLLFEVETATLTTSYLEYSVESVQAAFAINTTDRLIIKFYAKTTGALTRNISYTHNGTSRYSHVHSPMAQRHNQLAGLNEGDYQHLSATQKTIATQAATDSLNGYLSTTDHAGLIRREKSFCITADASWNAEAIGVFQFPDDARGGVIERVDACIWITEGSPTLNFNLIRRPVGTLGGSVYYLFSSDQVADEDGITITSLQNATWAARDYITFYTPGSAVNGSGIVHWILVTVYFRIGT